MPYLLQRKLSLFIPQYELVLFDHTNAGTHTIIHVYAPQPGACCGLPNPTWSPDGQWIAFQTRGEENPQGLWISRPDGSDAYHLGLATNQVWSPDSQHLAYLYGFANPDPTVTATVNIIEVSSWNTFTSSLPAWSIPPAWVAP